MFDEQPEGDPHGECAKEIHDLQAALDRANKLAEKHMKHNGALEIAIQEAHRDTDKANLQVDELRKHLDKLVAEGNRCLEIPEFWDDGLSDALDEAITYLDGTEKPITEKRKCDPSSYHCYNHDREDHGGHTVCCRCGERP